MENKCVLMIIPLILKNWLHKKSICLVDSHVLSRYEFQKDQSLLGEVEFAYDHDWLKSRIQGCLEFWKGEREASYIPDEERWKCKYCQFASVCPAIGKPESSRSPLKINPDSIPS
ncbi:hypothetical protein Dsin_020098 [Dipteronia sinensis]|uniref:PD-(D/E)XK endonuclease-like domain-containing protein n=1 Tax=Dipteronia sinensis TaxID=43782 RepID=A0AAE0E360_9ROSI|nr:hypothetical protein Dsin_020098 [Dipteronia sinensis]